MERAMMAELETQKPVIMSIPSIGNITGSIILGKIGDIHRFGSAEKLVAFVGMHL